MDVSNNVELFIACHVYRHQEKRKNRTE